MGLSVGYQNTEGDVAYDIRHFALVALTESEGDNDEDRRAAYESAVEGEPVIAEARFGVFDIAVNGLKQRREAEARRRGNHSVHGNEIYITAFDFIFFCEAPEDDEASEHAHSHQNAVKCDEAAYFVRIHAMTSVTSSMQNIIQLRRR